MSQNMIPSGSERWFTQRLMAEYSSWYGIRPLPIVQPVVLTIGTQLDSVAWTFANYSDFYRR